MPTNAHSSSVKLILKFAFFGVLTPSSWSLQVLSAAVLNFWIDKIKYSSMSLCKFNCW